MALYPSVRTANLADVGPGELIRLSWSGQVRYALTAQWEQPNTTVRLLFLLPQLADEPPTYVLGSAAAWHKQVISFGQDYAFTYDVAHFPRLPEEGPSGAVGFFVSPAGLVIRAAAMGPMGPDPWAALDAMVDTGVVPPDHRPNPFGYIPAWSIVLPGLNGGPGTTLLSFPPEAASP